MTFADLDKIDRIAAGFEQLELVRQMLLGNFCPNIKGARRILSSSRPCGLLFSYSRNNPPKRSDLLRAQVGPSTRMTASFIRWLHNQPDFTCSYCLRDVPIKRERHADHVIPISVKR